MSQYQDTTFTNIDLVNNDTNLLHQVGTGTFYIDSVHGTLKIGHTGQHINLVGDIYLDGNFYGATGGPTSFSAALVRTA